ncbi:hypothetical protein GPECTOR_39g493 [Gonium pectorale]|uniref:Uncharacterized protein n=1 Tax=Gonium pectorale TaxID=33097 RepID=A0A150GAZ8_GONPE|nr:hypothetical protein GPECTOR_39g493 [Gonium pectorale]|eukprot:KXZ46999.1 hypothetical protein GPECTOR_39g493 [Gonium pectorale]
MDNIVMAELVNGSGPEAGRPGGPLAKRGSNVGGGLLSTPGEGVVTSLAFRPDQPGSRIQNVLLAAQGDALVHVHIGTKRVLHTNYEPGNRLNVVSMRPDGAAFATAGSDYTVRVYDEATCSTSHTLDHGDGVTTNGHASNVFALAWHPDEPQVLLSGGWDNRVLVWDLRVHRAVRSISGPHICGDAIDVQPGSGIVLTGSWRHANPLQLWDLGSGRLLTNLPWWQPEPNGCLPYAARFGPGACSSMIIAGGSGPKPMVRVYKMKALGDVDLLYTVRLQRPVNALAPLLHPEAAMAVCCDQAVHTIAL